MSESLRSLAAAQYWAMERVHLSALIKAASEMKIDERLLSMPEHDEEREIDTSPYGLADVQIADGVAILPVRGTIVKEVPELWRMCACDACGMIEFQAAARELAADDSVRSVLLAIDSPGGTIGGVAESADAIRLLRAAKPVHAAISDCGASAAYWLASQAETIAANSTAHVGSIGVYTWLADSHRAYEGAGYDIHLVASGSDKGAGMEGVRLSQDQLDTVRENIMDLAESFAEEVRSGRKMDSQQIAEVRSGRTWIAPRARALGLIDNVETFAQTLARVAGV